MTWAPGDAWYPRFELNTDSFMRPAGPEHCLAYLRTISQAWTGPLPGAPFGK